MLKNQIVDASHRLLLQGELHNRQCLVGIHRVAYPDAGAGVGECRTFRLGGGIDDGVGVGDDRHLLLSRFASGVRCRSDETYLIQCSMCRPVRQ